MFWEIYESKPQTISAVFQRSRSYPRMDFFFPWEMCSSLYKASRDHMRLFPERHIVPIKSKNMDVRINYICRNSSVHHCAAKLKQTSFRRVGPHFWMNMFTARYWECIVLHIRFWDLKGLRKQSCSYPLWIIQQRYPCPFTCYF